MTSGLPIIRKFFRAESDRDRTQLLLRCPDSVLFKHAAEFREACRKAHFDTGEDFIDLRLSLLAAVRDADGLLPAKMVQHVEIVRQLLVRFVAGQISIANSAPAPEWPLDAPQPPGALDI